METRQWVGRLVIIILADWQHTFYQQTLSCDYVLGDNVNKFINENDQDVLKEMSGVITAVIKPVLYRIYSTILGKVPVEELFLS